MRDRIVLGAEIAVVLACLWASYDIANKWRNEGTRYEEGKKADGTIERDDIVAKGEEEATVISRQFTSLGQKMRDLKKAEGDRQAAGIVAVAETYRVLLNNESTAASAEAMKAITGKEDRKTRGILDKY